METVIINQIKKQSYTMKESLRALKTSISFSGKGIKSILFTSSVPNEGKSTVVMDLARSMADSKKAVLIVDTDMRKSVLVGRLRAQVESGGTIYGLSHYLSGQVSLDNIVYATTIPRVFIIFAGHEVPNPTELLESKEFAELIKFGEENFDYVLVDTPPTGAAIDAAVVGKNVDGAVVVAAQNATSSRAIINTKRTLEDSGVRILGAVLNKVKFEGSRYGGYYGSYYKGYYGGYGGYGGYYGHYGHDNDDDEVFIGRDLAHTRGYGEGVATAIDQEVKRIIDECYAKARQIITENRSVLDACAKLLLEKEKISQKEFEALFETDHVVL